MKLRRGAQSLLLFGGLLTNAMAADDAPPLWVAIGDPSLTEPLKSLAAHRAAQGMAVQIEAGSVSEVLDNLPRDPGYVFLVGDDRLDFPAETTADETEASPPKKAGWLPGERRRLYRWRATQAETFVSDAILGDLDGDGIPEVPVGRLPARTPAEVSAYVDKVIEFEKVMPRVDDLSLPVWAGDPNYGTHFHAAMASQLLRETLKQAPPWLETWLIIGNPRDPLSGWPPDQGSLFERRIAEGGVLAGMMGHGSCTDFFSVRHENEWMTYNVRKRGLDEGSSLRPVSPPVVIFACDCGNFAHAEESLGESWLRARAGPVAVIAATTESHPLPNYYSSVALLQALKDGEMRLGDLWVKTQREGYAKKIFLVEAFLAGIEGKLEAKLDTPRIRKDHLMLYALLGDPATRLRLPRPLQVSVGPEGNEAPRHWTVEKPTGAERLVVSHRPPQEAPVMEEFQDREAARKRFLEGNVRLAFAPIREYEADEVWEGSFAGPGTIRWVATSRDWIYAAGLYVPAAD